jgi:hypothetical protein
MEAGSILERASDEPVLWKSPLNVTQSWAQAACATIIRIMHADIPLIISSFNLLAVHINTEKMRVFRGRGQVGLEMIISLALILMVFSIVVLMAMGKISESADIKTYVDARRVSESIKDNIDMISQEGPGYYSYFSMPEKLQGDYDYNVSLTGNLLELMWADKTWSTKLTASNITVLCISKGMGVKNRLIFGARGIEVACQLPNLKIVPGTFVVNELVNGTNATMVKVINDAHVDSPPFVTAFKTNGTTTMYSTTDPLGAGQTVTFQFNKTASVFADIYVDYYGEVNETTKSDNNITAALP